jgi:hypothetical protein
MEQWRRPIRRSGGRFCGFRVNCEQVPVLPALAVRAVLDDPRRVPYLFLWQGRGDGEIKEAVRVARSILWTQLPEAEAVEIKRTDGSIVPTYLQWRWQPHGGRSLLLRCWRCQRPSRTLYGAGVGDDGRYYVVRRADWECRRCAGLRYSSEGGALIIRSRLFGRARCDRPDLWYPLVFSSPTQAGDAGLI